MKFSSKKDVIFIILFWGPAILFLLPLVETIIGSSDVETTGGVIFAQSIMAFLGLFLIWVWFGTKYKIDKQKFVYSFGPLRETINIHDIQKVEAIRSAMISPCLSLQRIEITFRQDKKPLQISPADRVRFAQALKKENHRIQLCSELQEQVKEN